ncbi:MFS transporter [Tateyamaria pelophila]|uniref:MFS transporter n=1 Tax=Tateyamaria pelophila TaxID=328415 RepID=UPI001CC157CF|nr:MFS transporter [Tateyamaria pelophila]
MRWRILVLLFLARVGLGLQFQTLASVGDDLVVAFGLDYAGIGLLIGLFMAPGLFLAIPAGYWARYVSDRHMVVLGLGALAFGGLVSAGAVDSWTIGAGRVLAGIGFLFATLYLTKMVADWFQGREIATAMSLLVMSWPFGIAMGQLGYAWISDAFGWHIPFQIASIYCALAAVGVLIFYKDPDDLAPVKHDGASARLTGQEWRLILIAGSAWGAINAGYIIYLSFGPKVLEALGHSALAAAGTISVGSWVMIASGALCGQIADRSGQRMTILFICMTTASAALLLLSLPGAGLGASLLFGLIGMAPAGIIMALAGEAVRPQARAFGTGVFLTVYYAFTWVAPPAAGAILDATGSIQGPIWLAILLFAAVIPLAIAYQRENGHPVVMT